MRCLSWTVLPIVLSAALLFSATATANAAEEDQACLACHGDAAALTKARSDPGTAIEPLLVDAEKYANSIHASKGCLECHFDHEELPHPDDAESATCTDCHDKAGEEYAESVHGKLGEDSSKVVAKCADCHGVHDVLRATDRNARLYPLNVHRVCGKCHFSVDAETATLKQLDAEPLAQDSHARGILHQGLKVSATCVSCHGGHETRPMGDPSSRVSRQNVAETCGECHVAILEQYRTSVHHLRSEGEEHVGATCSDCHTHHEIQRPGVEFHGSIASTCSECHEERGGTFRQSYHGKRATVGFEGKVAGCDACHGAHDIKPMDDAESRVHPDNVVETCAKCHEGAHEEFTNYLVHADIGDGENFPTLNLIYKVMTGVLVITIILGCLHALLWLVRALAAGEWRRPAMPKSERFVRRWPAAYAGYHMVLMITVLLLAVTGLPLHFAGEAWADDVMRFFGGVGAAGWVHRVSAVAMIGLAVVFLIHTAYRLVIKREKGLFAGPNSMLPRWKDVQDLVGNLRWFLFLGERPKYDRWTYWEKFDFWAVFWGCMVIGLSGAIMWFPVTATRYLPGWFVNAAVIVHGIEALLDIAFIFTVHVFHANLRPDKFPMDTMFLTGRIPESEFRHERPLEYERAVADGSIDGMLTARVPRPRSRLIAYVIGSLALGVGFFFLGAFILAVLTHGVI